MEWIFENLGLIVFALAALSFLRGVIRAAKSDQKKSAAPRRHPEEDPEAAERTRRIQEQIRRKIAERQGVGGSAEMQPPLVSPAEPSRRELIPPVLPPRPAPVDPFGGPMRKLMRKIEEAAEQRVEQVDHEATLRRQRALEEQMRELEARREAEQRRVAELAARREAASAVARQRSFTPAGSFREELRDPSALRRAFVLKEVLGPPVSLR